MYSANKQYLSVHYAGTVGRIEDFYNSYTEREVDPSKFYTPNTYKYISGLLYKLVHRFMMPNVGGFLVCISAIKLNIQREYDH